MARNKKPNVILHPVKYAKYKAGNFMDVWNRAGDTFVGGVYTGLGFVADGFVTGMERAYNGADDVGAIFRGIANWLMPLGAHKDDSVIGLRTHSFLEKLSDIELLEPLTNDIPRMFEYMDVTTDANFALGTILTFVSMYRFRNAVKR